MTWSLIARDERTGELGIAVATRFFGVGARVPFIAPKVGAIATQALVNPYYGIDGLRLLREGNAPDRVLAIVLNGDSGREHRQVHIVDAKGSTAGHAGASCPHWAGHHFGHGFSVAGNTLAGPQVLEQTSQAYQSTEHHPMARRLILAMQAGEAAGGDRRGKQSAALLIFRDDEWSALDIRVDDHPDPLRELDRLERVSNEEWGRYRPFVPTRSDPVGVTDHAVIDAAVGTPVQEV